MKNHWQDSRCPAQDLNPRTPKYKAGEKRVCLFSTSRGSNWSHFLHPAYISEPHPCPNHLSLKLDVMPLILKMDATYSSETSVSTYITTQCQNQDVCNVQNPQRENLQNVFISTAPLCVEKGTVVHMTGSNMEDVGMWGYSSNHSYPRGLISLSTQPLYTQDKSSQYQSNRKLSGPDS